MGDGVLGVIMLETRKPREAPPWEGDAGFFLVIKDSGGVIDGGWGKPWMMGLAVSKEYRWDGGCSMVRGCAAQWEDGKAASIGCGGGKLETREVLEKLEVSGAFSEVEKGE